MRHIPHLYLPTPWEDSVITVPEPTIAHLRRVLRLDPDASVTYTDGNGTVGEGTWTGTEVERGPERLRPRPRPTVHLAVAPPRSKDRQRFVVEKLQELAVDELTWITTERCQARPPRRDRAGAWAVAALEQSRGAWLMAIGEGDLAGVPAPILLDADATEPLADVDVAGRIVAVGPEGGFTEGERAGRDSVRLGTTVLRTETAAIAAAALLRTR